MRNPQPWYVFKPTVTGHWQDPPRWPGPNLMNGITLGSPSPSGRRKCKKICKGIGACQRRRRRKYCSLRVSLGGLCAAAAESAPSRFHHALPRRRRPGASQSQLRCSAWHDRCGPSHEIRDRNTHARGRRRGIWSRERVRVEEGGREE